MPLLLNKNTAAVSELTKDISPFAPTPAPARFGPHNVHPSPIYVNIIMGAIISVKIMVGYNGKEPVLVLFRNFNEDSNALYASW